ncbi:hypothetical protein Golob_010029 [Gossypium lobatum]|uniref:Protein kinase domain-containing protein n=1 Tax=Gossypium lobatum TaxID=34289 RepID=A0A7J8MK83_9ROSI|nr:hypothetical protein [Gossypium lobatum]
MGANTSEPTSSRTPRTRSTQSPRTPATSANPSPKIRTATNNFLAKRYSSTSSSAVSAAAYWRCNLRGRDTVVFQRKFRRKIQTSQLKERLSIICRSNHMSIIKLLGASISGDHIYLVYEFIQGSNLVECLRNPRNPSYTVLSTWISRMQIATDLAHESNASFRELKRNDSGDRHFEGLRDYMSPEFRSSGSVTQKSDVFAFGVVILELLSGEEPLKYRYDKETGDFLRTSVIDTATAATAEGREGLRQWVDRRMNDSFPVEVAEKLIRLALDCVHVDPDNRPDMGRVAGKISKLYLESRIWLDNVKVPTGISVSLAPR